MLVRYKSLYISGLDPDLEIRGIEKGGGRGLCLFGPGPAVEEHHDPL